jgi:hypothetical protein
MMRVGLRFNEVVAVKRQRVHDTQHSTVAPKPADNRTVVMANPF